MLIPYIISNLAALLLAFCSWKWPFASRGLYTLLFGWACWFNLSTSIHTPEVYVSYAPGALLQISRLSLLVILLRTLPYVYPSLQ